jgi:hypothetical protein
VSIAVEPADLPETAARFGDAAYVLTAGADGRPHVSHVRVRVGDGTVEFTAGRSTRANLASRPAVVLWPPYEPGGFSLIVDAAAAPGEATGDVVVLVATHAVLHRPA